MSDAADYLSYIRSLILLEDAIVRWQIIREEDLANSGMLRYRLNFTGPGFTGGFRAF